MAEVPEMVVHVKVVHVNDDAYWRRRAEEAEAKVAELDRDKLSWRAAAMQKDREHENTQRLFSKYKSDFGHCPAEIVRLNGRISELEKERDEWKSSAEWANEKVGELADERVTATSRIAELERQLAVEARRAKERYDELAKHCTSVEKCLANVGRDKERLEKRVEELERQLTPAEPTTPASPTSLEAVLEELATEGLSFHVVLETMDTGNIYVQFGVNADSFENLDDTCRWIQLRAIEDNPDSDFARRRAGKETPTPEPESEPESEPDPVEELLRRYPGEWTPFKLTNGQCFYYAEHGAEYIGGLPAESLCEIVNRYRRIAAAVQKYTENDIGSIEAMRLISDTVRPAKEAAK